MKRTPVAVTVGMVTALLSATSASAQADYRAEVMASRCREFANSMVSPEGILVKHDFDTGFCFGLFTMALRVVLTSDSQSGERFFGACAPVGSTVTQLAKVFVRFCDNHPEQLNEDFYVVLLSALHQAFPCGRGQ